MSPRNRNGIRWIAFTAVVAGVALSAARAEAGIVVDEATATRDRPRLHAGTLRLREPLPLIRLADTAVVNPAPAQTTAPAQVVQQPQRVVHTDVKSGRSYMATMAWSAIMGGVLGAVVGTAVYYLDDGQRPRNIAYWAAGGVLLGTGVGLVEIMIEESRTERAVGVADPAPTARLALYRRAF